MIKTILYIILFIGLINTLGAQNSFHVSTAFTTEQGGIDKEISPSLVIRNLTNKTLKLKWEIDKSNLPEGWLAVVCDHQCYTSLIKSRTFTLEPKEVLHDFKVSFRPNGKEGIGNLVVSLEDLNNTNTTHTITFSGAANSAVTTNNKIRQHQAAAPKIYPNPAIEYIYLKDDLNKVKLIEIYNVVGRKLLKFSINHSNDKYDISKLPRGMYMVRMLDKRGTIVRTQRISKYNP